MRYYLTLLCTLLLASLLLSQGFAQQRSPQVEITGLVEYSLTITAEVLQGYKIYEKQNVKIVSSGGEVRKEFKTLKGVRLKDLLEKAKIQMASPKEKGKLYIVAQATDGYAAIFSHNELFNNPSGEDVLLVFEENGQPINEDGALVLMSLSDTITGARHVKWLKTIEVRKL